MLKNMNVLQYESEITNNNVLILDVRTPEEYEYAHIEDSFLIPLNEIPERIQEIEMYKNLPVRIYCKAGVRSAYAGDFLISEGFSDVAHLETGIIGWISNEKKVIR